MIKYTPEQGDILDFIPDHEGILLVSAGAGTGKSFMAKQIAAQLQPRTGLYTAFNKAIVKEGSHKFQGLNMECKTLHALAYHHVKPGELQDLSYTCIEEDVPYRIKYLVIDGINQFFVSASTDMYDFFEEHFQLEERRELLAELSCKYVEKMLEGSVKPTFNFMLKYFHLLLEHGDVDCSYDLVILDEINDTTAVALEIFKLINAPKKLGLGETNQAIYQFLNLVDGFEELQGVPVMNLTQSFRCSAVIAKRIQTMMRKDVDEKFTFVGTDEPVANGKSLYCTRTNAMIIKEIASCLESRQGFHLLRDIKEIFACPLALMSASQGKDPYQKKYKYLIDEYHNWQENRDRNQSFFEYLLEVTGDDEVESAVRLLMLLKKKHINLFKLYEDAKNAIPDPKYTIATVFTAKGLEYETVYIGDDLNRTIEKIREKGGIKDLDDLVSYRCYYVACSRAGKNLENALALDVKH